MIKSEFYDIKGVNDILYNSDAKIVSVFKDHLIYDDICEFFTAYHKINDSINFLMEYSYHIIELQSKLSYLAQIP